MQLWEAKGSLPASETVGYARVWFAAILSSDGVPQLAGAMATLVMINQLYLAAAFVAGLSRGLPHQCGSASADGAAPRALPRGAAAQRRLSTQRTSAPSLAPLATGSVQRQRHW